MRCSSGTRGVALGHLALHLDRAAHRIDDAGELDEHAVAGRLDDAAACARRSSGRSSSRRWAFSRASVPSSSAPISRQYPATSAARIAASRRSTRSRPSVFINAIIARASI